MSEIKRIELLTRQYHALCESVLKWQAIVAEEGTPDGGPSDCKCCQEFRKENDAGIIYCSDCPVCAHTGKHWCAKTPYDKWTEYFDTPEGIEESDLWLQDNGVDPDDLTRYFVCGEESRKLAQAELDFLVMLRNLWKEKLYGQKEKEKAQE